MTRLKDRQCIACERELTPVTKEELDSYLGELNEGWKLVDGFLQKEYKFGSFNKGLDFANKIGELCNKEKHHPVLKLSWPGVVVMLKTFKLEDLSINDFILAAKIDEIK